MYDNRVAGNPEPATNAEILEGIVRRITGCSALFCTAGEEIVEKIVHIRHQERELDRTIDIDDEEQPNRLPLADSSKLARAIEDLQAIRTSVDCLITELQLLTSKGT